MLIRLTAPMLGMIEGVALPRDDSPFELPDVAAADLIKRGLAERVKAEPEPAVETRVVEASEKRGPGRPPAAK